MMYNKPPFRKLRGYAFDPITSLDLDTAEINQIVYKIPWEDHLEPGPEGEYIKVIDRDPASKSTYAPVDLNDPLLLASDGLTPSEANPQFHQQMVYAVVMSTITNFEKALGRKVMWSPLSTVVNNVRTTSFVEKLLVYPHAVRDENAYYSPDRKALLFGYYNATPSDASLFLPGGIVYSCLSHDIVAHETTHAILDGIYSRFMETTHPDVPAFHEGFADLVALLQHFMYPEIVKSQVRKVRGELDAESMLGKLAIEFGQSTGDKNALRDAIGEVVNDKWQRKVPNTSDYDTTLECHDRGALLVSAVFDAYIAIYKNRTADLLRIATSGSGVLPEGELHPDLVNRLSEEASKAASHVLNMCVRALDYCPPLDIHYGDYLRALITADKELVANDDQNYRIAFINAFRKRGIFPEGLPNLSVDTLCYNELDNAASKTWLSGELKTYLRSFKDKLSFETDRETIFNKTRESIRGDYKNGIKGLHSYLFDPESGKKDPYVIENLTGLVFSDQFPALGIKPSKTYKDHKVASVEIHSVRLNNRTGPDGNLQNQIIMTLSQRCTVSVKEAADGSLTFPPLVGRGAKKDEQTFTFRGGCTLIFDLNTLTLKHAITKPIFDPKDFSKGRSRKLKLNPDRLAMQYNCIFGGMVDQMGFAPGYHQQVEPFASIHQPKNISI